MDFFTETEQKIKAVKEFAKRRIRPLAIIAAAGVTCGITSCSEYHSYNATTVSYITLDGRKVKQSYGGSLRDYTRAVRDVSDSTRSISQAARTLRQAFR